MMADKATMWDGWRSFIAGLDYGRGAAEITIRWIRATEKHTSENHRDVGRANLVKIAKPDDIAEFNRGFDQGGRR